MSSPIDPPTMATTPSPSSPSASITLTTAPVITASPSSVVDPSPSAPTSTNTMTLSPIVPASNPSTSASSSVVLDHRMFPHIFDMILEAAPYQSQLCLRRMSRDACERVERIMCRHIILSDWFSYQEFPISLPGGKTCPVWEPESRGIISDADADRIRRWLQRARVVDLREPLLDYPFWFNMTPDDFLGVHTLKINPMRDKVRFDNVDYWFTNVKTFVCCTVVRLDEEERGLLVGSPPPLPGRVERVVDTFVIFHLDPYTSPVRIPPRHYPNSVREVVITVDHVTGCIPAALDARVRDQGCHMFDWLGSLVDFERLGRVKYTLVDLHCGIGTLPSFVPPQATNSTLENLIHEYIAGELCKLQKQNDWSDDDVMDKAAAVETLSNSEYEARVGSDQFDFEIDFLAHGWMEGIDYP